VSTMEASTLNSIKNLVQGFWRIRGFAIALGATAVRLGFGTDLRTSKYVALRPPPKSLPTSCRQSHKGRRRRKQPWIQSSSSKMATNGNSYQKVPNVDASHYESIPNGTSNYTSHDDRSGKKKWIAGAAVLAALAVAYGCYAWQPNKTAVIDSIGKSLLHSSASTETTGKLKLFDDTSTCICGADCGRSNDQQQAIHSQYVSLIIPRSFCHGRLRRALDLFILSSRSGWLLWQACVGLLRQPWPGNLHLWY
jgi:hypothetical protein